MWCYCISELVLHEKVRNENSDGDDYDEKRLMMRMMMTKAYDDKKRPMMMIVSASSRCLALLARLPSLPLGRPTTHLIIVFVDQHRHD